MLNKITPNLNTTVNQICDRNHRSASFNTNRISVVEYCDYQTLHWGVTEQDIYNLHEYSFCAMVFPSVNPDWNIKEIISLSNYVSFSPTFEMRGRLVYSLITLAGPEGFFFE